MKLHISIFQLDSLMYWILPVYVKIPNFIAEFYGLKVKIRPTQIIDVKFDRE